MLIRSSWPAVNDESLSADEVAARRGEEEDRADEVVRRHAALYGAARGRALQILVSVDVINVTANDAYTAASESVWMSDGKRGPIVDATKSNINKSNRSKDHASIEANPTVATCR